MDLNEVRSVDRHPKQEKEEVSLPTATYNTSIKELIARRKALNKQEANDPYDEERDAFISSLTKNDPRFENVVLSVQNSGAFEIQLEGHRLGTLRIKNNKEGDIKMPEGMEDTSSITFIVLDEKVRGKGLAMKVYRKIYELLQSTGERFVSDPIRLSSPALRFWEKLVSIGVASRSGEYNSNNQPIFEYIQ